MDFLAPGFLWLLLATPLPFLAASARRAPGHAALRALALALMALALARPARVVDTGATHHVFLLDRSPSVSADLQLRAINALTAANEALEGDARTVLLHWGSTEPLDIEDFDEQRDLGLGSPLGAGLRAALAEIPDGESGAVYIGSDFEATSADWGAVAAQLSSRDIPVHTLAVSDENFEARIVGLKPEGLLRVGHPARLQVILDGRADAVVSLHRAGEDEALATSESLRISDRTVVPLVFEPSEAGFLELEARIEVSAGPDIRVEDNSYSRTVAVQDPLRVLYLGGRVRGSAASMSAAAGPGFAFDAVEDPTQANPADYPLVVVDDRPADQVPESFQQELAEAVANGGTGLMMSGGAGAFGPGGWFETTVSELLPVEFVQKEEKRDPSTTLCVIIDTSGSMGGNRVQLAKEVARLAISRLLPHDKVGIVEFYGAKRWAAPIQPASNRIELERALNRMDAGGGTVILPAVEEAFYGMQNVQTRYKHVLILTDGGVETGPFESMMRQMADKGMNVSTVLIGPETHSEFLVNIANWGKGRFYNVPNRFNLPEVILKQPASAKLPAYRPGTHSVEGRGSAAWWGGTDPESVPPIAGYVETRARDGAEVLLQTRDGKHPVFASWRYGLGRVSALTTEPAGPGTGSWGDWDGYGGFLSQTLARTAAAGVEPFRFELNREGGFLRLTAERRIPTDLEPAAEWLGSETELLAPQFREIAPGLFEARMAFDPDSQARVRASAAGRAATATLLVSDARADVAPEYQVDPLERMNSRTLSAATGGARLSAVDSTPDSTTALELTEYAPALLLLALALFVIGIWWRRRPDFRGGPA